MTNGLESAIRDLLKGAGVPALAVTFVNAAGFVRASLAPPTGSCSRHSIPSPRVGHGKKRPDFEIL